MKEAMERINKAFGYLCVLLVSGDNVERVAMAKQELSKAYAKLEVLVAKEEAKAEEGKEESDGPTD